jgi:acylphosphatase
MSCRRCLVAGTVQGVWYRASTQRQALALGLTGYARNLPDGRVEVLACGEEDALRQLQDWLWQGPPAAEVTDVQCTPAADAAPEDFQTC